MPSKPRLAIVVSHPIQHFVHLYRAIAAGGEAQLKVFFCSKIGLQAYHDTEMNTVIRWAGDMTAGYDHEFLPGADKVTRVSFSRVNNSGVGARLSEYNPDAVMLYGYAQITQLKALFWCRLRRVPVLMTGDGDFVKQRSTLRAMVRARVLKTLLAQVSAFLTVGDQNEAMLASLGVPRARMFRTPFPIDEESYLDHRARRAQVRAAVRTKYAIAEDAFVLLYVGKISERKRPRDLVAAWQRMSLAAGAPLGITLLYCGDGPDRPALEKAIKDAGAPAVIAGFVNVDELPAFYCAADVLVHPSEHDPHPLVCSEAACIGLPMVLSDRVGAVGPTDIAREGANALVYPFGDVEALAAAVRKLAGDAALYQKMAASSLTIYGACGLAASVAGLLKATRSALPAE